jgi:hypothetical protein
MLSTARCRATVVQAAIFADDPTVTTFSMHCGDQSFPRTLMHSNVDVALPAGTGDAAYMQVSSSNNQQLVLRCLGACCWWVMKGSIMHAQNQMLQCGKYVFEVMCSNVKTAMCSACWRQMHDTAAPLDV